jgi:hypothetical protein
MARRGEDKASVRKSLEAYYQYVEDDLWTENAAIVDASPSAVEAICQTEPNLARPSLFFYRAHSRLLCLFCPGHIGYSRQGL